MTADLRRMLLACSMPLLYAAIAYSAILSAERRYDDNLVRDRTELDRRLRDHGLSAAQATDVTSYEASAAHATTGYIGSVAFAVVGMMSFLGVTLGSVLGAPRKKDANAGP